MYNVIVQNFVKSLGQVCAVIGAQCGDEGKGKLTDIFSDSFDVIARGSGGPNTTHTTVVSGKTFTFQMLPSGYLHEDKIIVLGAGMAIHLPTLLTEISVLQEAGIDVLPQLYVSPCAHIVFDHHRRLDAFLATKSDPDEQGLLSASVHKSMRIGMRMEQLRSDDESLRAILAAQKEHVEAWSDGAVTFDANAELRGLLSARELFFKRLILSIPELLHMFIAGGKRILIEGTKASLLDPDHGSYPHVSPTATTVQGALHGLGLPPKAVTSCVGVFKPYSTRTDSGEMPTEIREEACPLRDALRQKVDPDAAKRLGWLYLPDLHYAALVNGFDVLALSKLDIFDGFEEVRIGTGYDENGDVVFETFPGWKGSVKGVRSWSDLPAQALAMIAFIETQVKTPVGIVGTGPERDDLVIRPSA